MSFVRFVEVGRVCLINYGPDAGKLCTIVNVIDNNRIMVDGPEDVTGVHRHALNVKRVQLTDLKVAAKLNCSKKTLMGLWASEGVLAKWDVMSQAKKRKAHALRSSANDFERFQVQVAKTARSAKRKAA